jgi:hypothetical protein
MTKQALQIIFCFWPALMLAQTNNIKIETNYNSKTFLNFVDSIEKQHHISFFFNKQWLDSVAVKQTQVPSSLEQVLKESFNGSDLNYLIDGSNIIITQNYKVRTTLPQQFFRAESQVWSILSDTTDLAYSFIGQAKKKDADNSITNIGNPSSKSKGDKGVVSGLVRNEENGEPLIGAQVYEKNAGKVTITDVYGYYSITLPKGNNEIVFKNFGRKDKIVSVMVYTDGTLNVEMKENPVQISEVVVTSDKGNQVKNLNIGVQSLKIEEIKQLPSFMGEVDIIKSTTLLPGVQTVGEG